jgi:hypothetical protein
MCVLMLDVLRSAGQVIRVAPHGATVAQAGSTLFTWPEDLRTSTFIVFIFIHITSDRWRLYEADKVSWSCLV